MKRSHTPFYGLLAALLPLLVFAIVAPMHAPFLTPSLYDNARFFQIACLSVFALVVVVVPGVATTTLGCWRALPSPYRVAIAVFGALASASVVFSIYPGMGSAEFCLLALLVVAGFAVSAVVALQPRIGDSVLTYASVLGALEFAVVFWVAFLAAQVVSGRFEWVSPFVSFANVRFFSQWQAYTLSLVLIPVLDSKLPTHWRLAAFAISIHCWMLQFAVGTRAVWIAVILATAFIGISVGRPARTWVRVQLAAILGGGVLYLILRLTAMATAPGIADIARRGFDSSERLVLWKSALGMILEAPMLGIGPMHYSFRQFEIAAHPHNSLLQLAAEYGAPAAIIVTALLLSLLVNAVRWCRANGDETIRNTNLCLLAALVMGLADSMLSGNTIMPHSQMMLVLVMGWLVGRNARVDSGPFSWPQGFSYSIGGAAIAALALASTLVTIGAGLAYFRVMEPKRFEMPFEPHPRFWQQGHWPVKG